MLKLALIGQTNVGKSTLFNRLTEKGGAIVSSLPETTRDRNYDICRWRGKEIIIVDTGGLVKIQIPLSERQIKKAKALDDIGKEVKKHILKAIEESDLILFICDVNKQISDFEMEIGQLIKKNKKKALLVLNKADNQKKILLTKNQNWLKLGFGQPIPISAASGVGVGDLLDKVFAIAFKNQNNQPAGNETSFIKNQSPIETPIKAAIIGRPNVGKSTLINSLLNEERFIVSPLPQTTRGPQDVLIQTEPGKENLLLIDTAGLRKKVKIKPGIEKIGAQKSLATIKKSDIILVLLDLSEEISHQDKSLIDLAIKNNKGLILILNKGDKIPGFKFRPSDFDAKLRKLPLTVSWAPILFISAKAKKNTEQIFPLINQVAKNLKQQISDKELNDFLRRTVEKQKFDSDVWKKIKIHQTDVCPPSFFLEIPKVLIRKRAIHPAQINIIEKQMRKKWDFRGAPIIIRISKY